MGVRIIGNDLFVQEKILEFIDVRYDTRSVDVCCILPDMKQKENIAGGVVLLPGDLACLWAESISAACVATYGACGRETLTYSSRIGKQEMASLQRDLRTPWGIVVESQEFYIPAGGGDMYLAVGGLLLLMGESPDNIGDILRKNVIFGLPME